MVRPPPLDGSLPIDADQVTPTQDAIINKTINEHIIYSYSKDIGLDGIDNDLDGYIDQKDDDEFGLSNYSLLEYKLQKTGNQSLYTVAMVPLRKANIDTEFADKISTMKDFKESRLSRFSEVYANIKNVPKDIVSVLENPIWINMRKRTELLGRLQKYRDIFGDEKEMKYFIEYLLIHGLENLNQVLVHLTSSG